MSAATFYHAKHICAFEKPALFMSVQAGLTTHSSTVLQGIKPGCESHLVTKKTLSYLSALESSPDLNNWAESKSGVFSVSEAVKYLEEEVVISQHWILPRKRQSAVWKSVMKNSRSGGVFFGQINGLSYTPMLSPIWTNCPSRDTVRVSQCNPHNIQCCANHQPCILLSALGQLRAEMEGGIIYFHTFPLMLILF